MTNTGYAATLIDSEFSSGKSSRLEQVWDLSSASGRHFDTLRVVIHADFYADQSSARVSALRQTGWVELATASPLRWHDALVGKRSDVAREECAKTLALELVARAKTILSR